MNTVPRLEKNATKEFDFDDRKQDWHQKLGRVSNLFEKLAVSDDPSLAELDQSKRKLYDPFSKVVHWTPAGVIGEARLTLPAISLTFECLHRMSKDVNDDFDLDFGNDLYELWLRYQRYTAATLRIID